jgi:hypothetical protein
MALVSPELYSIGHAAIKRLQSGQSLKNWNDIILSWNSVFSGMQVISNRITMPHRDRNAAKTAYDILVSAGTHQHAVLSIPDIHTTLSYKPGTVVAICGRVLLHEVPDWGESEHICIAHFMRDAVHDRLGLPRAGWVSSGLYIPLMVDRFAERYKGWLQDK